MYGLSLWRAQVKRILPSGPGWLLSCRSRMNSTLGIERGSGWAVIARYMEAIADRPRDRSGSPLASSMTINWKQC